MENEPELIRDQMQETRTALTEKLDTLQQKVADTVESITTPMTETVQTVQEAVSDTVDSVKETVAGTVDTIKETFNLTRHVEQHPWPVMLGSVATGFVLGRLLPLPGGRAAAPGADSVVAGMSRAGKGHNGIHQALERPPQEEEAKEGGMFSGLAQAFQGELGKLTGLGVSVGVGLLRDLMTQSMQGEIGGRVKEWMDGLTEQLGAKPLAEPLVATEGQAEAHEEEKKEEPEGKSMGVGGKSSRETSRRW